MCAVGMEGEWAICLTEPKQNDPKAIYTHIGAPRYIPSSRKD